MMEKVDYCFTAESVQPIILAFYINIILHKFTYCFHYVILIFNLKYYKLFQLPAIYFCKYNF